MTQANVLSSNYIDVTQHDDNSRMVPGVYPQTNFLLASVAGSDHESIRTDNEGDFVFSEEKTTKKKADKTPLTVEQRELNGKLWLNYHANAKYYCETHNSCSENVEEILQTAFEAFFLNNRLDHTSPWRIAKQCLMAARTLGYYHHRNRKSSYRGANIPRYTAQSADELQAIKLVDSGELSINDAIDFFNIKNPALVAHLHAITDQYYAAPGQTVSFDAMVEEFGDAHINTADTYYSSDYSNSDTCTSASFTRATAQFELASKELGISPDDYLDYVASFKDFEPAAVAEVEDDFSPAWVAGTSSGAQIVKLTKPAPVVDSSVLASPFLAQAQAMKNAGVSIKAAAEELGLSVSAYRSRIARQAKKIQQAVESGQMVLDMFADAPVKTDVVIEPVKVKAAPAPVKAVQMNLFDAPPAPVVEEVADVAMVEVAMTPELTREQMLTVVQAIQRVRPVETSATPQTPSVVFQNTWIIPLSGTAMPTVDYGSGVQRYVSDAVDRGGGDGWWREAA